MTTEPATYRKKPVEIQAMRWNGTNDPELKQWTEGNFRTDPRLGQPEAQIWDKLHASWINVLRGQWVIRGVQGEFYPCDEDVFEQTYDEVPADTPSRPVGAVPAPVQGADPTGPQEAHSGDEEQCDECESKGRNCGAHRHVAERELLEEIGERDEAREWADRLAEAIAPVDVIGEHSSSNNPWERAVEAAKSLRERADKGEALIRSFVAERADYIQAIENCGPGNADNYHRWQGHAAARRQLGEQFAKLRAGTEEAQTVGASPATSNDDGPAVGASRVITAKFTTCRVSHDGYTCTNEAGHDGRHEDDEHSVSWPRSVGEEAQSNG